MASTIFTRPPVVTVATNLNSAFSILSPTNLFWELFEKTNLYGWTISRFDVSFASFANCAEPLPGIILKNSLKS